jgi:hypothetical protein
MIGALFYRGVAPSEIKEMPFRELEYWSDWHETISDTEARAMKGKTGGG